MKKIRRRYHPTINHNTEFELDLAPLLAVMVKLVPVLLLSSAFVQIMMIETELPQIVQAAIAQEEKQPNAPLITLNFDKNTGVEVLVSQQSEQKTSHIQLNQDKSFNYAEIHEEMKKVKSQHPTVFKVQFNPGADVSYQEIVRMMDEVRQSRDKSVRFPIKNEKTGEATTTEFMFPEVIFTQITEG